MKEYLIKGYSLNEKRLAQQNDQLKKLQETVKIISGVLDYKSLENPEAIGLLKIITDYAYGLDILDQYDYQNLEIKDVSGNKRIADNALVALTLMIAVSKPEEKDTMIKVIVSLINRRN